MTWKWVAVLMALAACSSAYAGKFSFSERERQQQDQEQQQKADEQQYIQSLLATPCGRGLSGKKTAVIVAERHSDGEYVTEQSNYGLLFTEINSRLRQIGLRTCTQEEIKSQIKAAEIEAFMNNDPDAQMGAASRLGASFILRGLIESRVTQNRVANVAEVSVTVSLVLVGTNGKIVGQSSVSGESYSGSDAIGTALNLVKEQADRAVAELYSSYCRELAVDQQ